MKYLVNPIIDAAFDSIVQNLRQALLLTLAAVLLAALVLGATWGPVVWRWQGEAALVPRVSGSQIGLMFLAVPVVFFIWFWVAVRWHRLSLDVPPGRIGLGVVLRYGLVSVAILLILFVPLMLLLLPVMSFVAGETVTRVEFGSVRPGLPLAVQALNVIVTFLFAYAFLRLSPWLVRMALDEKSAPALERTRPIRREIAHIAGIYTVATLLYGLVGTLSLPGALQVVVDLAVTWIAFMMSIAVLTEIYRLTKPHGAPPEEGVRIEIP